ncbi:hypothetical protein KC878_03015 [Candidatus Saccharibacteria bacterium]|nr:hypothetical protein [Candidatus Saccharibacteria bacterium]MCB9821407.1 hypothetical protein [Candidatus Nomurabacteria bacterium]
MHHIQQKILMRLAFNDSLRFSELKPDEYENKLFDYHLKQLLRDKLVEKDQTGNYTLTAVGRQVGIRNLTVAKSGPQAHTILFLAVRAGANGPWLLYKRLVHPLKDRIGFMHASPVIGNSLETAASQELLSKTGLTADFAVKGSGIFEMWSRENLESFTHFVLLYSQDISGQLQPSHSHAEYFWAEGPDFNSPDMLPNMPVLVDKLADNQLFFIQKTFNL